jgi:hypothetical protein
MKLISSYPFNITHSKVSRQSKIRNARNGSCDNRGLLDVLTLPRDLDAEVIVGSVGAAEGQEQVLGLLIDALVNDPRLHVDVGLRPPRARRRLQFVLTAAGDAHVPQLYRALVMSGHLLLVHVGRSRSEEVLRVGTRLVPKSLEFVHLVGFAHELEGRPAQVIHGIRAVM